MIFREIDFHIERYEKTPSSVERAMRLSINHIIDSIFLRMPKKFRTDSLQKLNCYACAKKPIKKFWAVDGVGMAFVDYPDAYSLPNYDDEQIDDTDIVGVLRKWGCNAYEISFNPIFN